jgi:diguanylate cyclase (GGDEF)-like protein
MQWVGRLLFAQSIMTQQAFTSTAVNDFMKERRRGLAFPPWLEAAFDRDSRERRAKIVRAASQSTVIVYNLFLIGDGLLAPDMFTVSAFLHLAVVTPWILLVAHFAPLAQRKWVREFAAASLSIVIVMQILTIHCLTRSPYAPHYLHFALIAMVCANTAQRLQYAYALFSTLVIFLMIVGALAVMRNLSAEIALAYCLSFVMSAVLTLNSNRIMERDQRRLYLQVLRERLRAEESASCANSDALTELGNRRYLAARAREVWRSRADDAAPVAAILFDIDHFKEFNDRHGHAAGDVCIKRVAACAFAERRGDDDLAVRYGGEEFLLLLPGADMSEAARVAERLRAAIETLDHRGGGERPPDPAVTASFGVSAAPTAVCSLEELIAAADAALYAAKRNGRNQVWPPLASVGAEGAAESDRGGASAA